MFEQIAQIIAAAVGRGFTRLRGGITKRSQTIETYDY